MRVDVAHMHNLVPVRCENIDMIEVFNQGIVCAKYDIDETVYVDSRNKVIIRIREDNSDNTFIQIHYNVEVDKKHKLMRYNMYRFGAVSDDESQRLRDIKSFHMEVIKSIDYIDLPENNGKFLHEEQYGGYTMIRFDAA